MPLHSRCQRQRTIKKCRICNNLDPRGHSLTQQDARSARATLTLSFEIRRMIDSTPGECRFCNVLIAALDGCVEVWRSGRGDRAVLFLGFKDVVRLEVFSQTRGWKGVEVFCPASRTPPWPALGLGRRMPQSSDSAESLDFARMCIDDCLKSSKHRLCHASPTYKPSRLLDVGLNDAADIRLYQPKISDDISYATLSHCWGKSPVLTLRTSTLQSFSQAIPLAILPPLFQDAVATTRRLEIRYLWIDSLCIIQDDRSDWEAESSRMASVYENSVVTIAAAAARGSVERLFTPYPPSIKIKYQNTSGKEFLIVARPSAIHHLRSTEVSAPDTPFRVQGPLTSRAWVLQEQVLSPRVLYFTPNELVFECRTGLQCQCRPRLKEIKTSMGWVAKLASAKDKDKIYGTWHRLVENYTSRNLSVETDKLPAISGVAEKFSNGLKGERYLAGLWKANIMADLLWCTKSVIQSQEPVLSARELYTAPSWSWASVASPVFFETVWDTDMEVTSLAELRSMTVTQKGLNPLGEISSGCIMINGLTAEATLISLQRQVLEDPLYKLKIAELKTMVTITPDSMLQLWTSSDDPESSSRSVQRAGHDCSPDSFSASVTCLLIRSTSDGSVSGLVLGRSSVEEGAYERLGVFSCGREVMGAPTRQDVKII